MNGIEGNQKKEMCGLFDNPTFGLIIPHTKTYYNRKKIG